jgi:putative DNA-invertase from lambdoid prophage Rac
VTDDDAGTKRAEFERDLLIERTNAGIAREKAGGKPLGRPSALSERHRAEVLQSLAKA